MSGRARLRADAALLAARYPHLLAAPGAPCRVLSADRIEQARQVVHGPARDPAQLRLWKAIYDEAVEISDRIDDGYWERAGFPPR